MAKLYVTIATFFLALCSIVYSAGWQSNRICQNEKEIDRVETRISGQLDDLNKKVDAIYAYLLEHNRK